MSDRVDTRTDIQALREYADPEVSMLGTVDMVVIEGIADRYESLAAERDTYRSAMQSALVLIDNGDAHKARSVLDAALGEGEDHD